jgi:hypothetical protein
MRAMRFARGFPLALVVAMLAASVLAAPPALKGNPNPGIIPPNAHFHGMTYGEWQAAAMQWIFSLPAADNPIFEGNEDKIANGQPKHVWFLANAAPIVNRHFTVPAGTGLYAVVNVVEWDNQICVDPDTNYTVDELRELAESFVDAFTDIEVQVDGVPVENIAAYRKTSPVFFSTTVEQICEAPPGTYGPMVADGYALLLAPLSVGEHTIHISGVVIVNPSTNIDVDVTWHITVVPHT